MHVKKTWSFTKGLFCPLCGSLILDQDGVVAKCPHIFALHIDPSGEVGRWYNLAGDFSDRYQEQCLQWIRSQGPDESEYDELSFLAESPETWPLIEAALDATSKEAALLLQIVEAEAYYPVIITIGIRP